MFSYHYRSVILSLVLSMAAVAVISTGSSIYILYNAAYKTTLVNLEDSARTLASMFESVAKFDQIHSNSDHPEGARGATLSQIRDALKKPPHYEGFHEIILGEFKDNTVHLMRFSQITGGLEDIMDLEIGSPLARPIQLGLKGVYGHGEMPDYEGIPVLAGFAPVPSLNIAVVYKIDLKEMQAPYIQAAIWSGLIAFIVISIGSLSFLYFTNPLKEKAKKNEERLLHSQKLSKTGTWELDNKSEILTWSEETCSIFGTTPASMENTYKNFLESVHPDDRIYVNESYNLSIKNKTNYDITHRIVLPDGSLKWVQEKGENIYDDSGNCTKTIGAVQDITVLKTAEEEIKRAAQIMHAVLDTTSVMFAYLDTDLNFVRVNKAYAEADGKEPDYFPGKNHFDLFPNRENEIIFKNVAATGIPHVSLSKAFEYEHNPERGVTHWDWSLTPIKDDNKQVTGLILSLTNVTERIKAVEAAEEKERLLNTIINHVPVGIQLSDGDTMEMIKINTKLHEQLGYTEEEFRNLPYTKIVQLSDEEIQNTGKDLQKYGYGEIETTQVTKEGEIRNICVKSKFFQNKGKKYYLSTIEDITEKKRSQNELLESKEIFKQFMDNSPAATYIKDKDLRFVYLNPVSEKAMLDVKNTDWMGKNLEEIFPEEIAAPLNAEAVKILNGSEPVEKLDSLQSKNGIRHILSVRFPIILSPEKRLLGATGIDVTDRIRAEEELKKLNLELENRVEERTRELTETYELNQKILTSASIGIASYKETGECVFANQVIADIVGAPREKVLLQNFRNISSWKENGLLEVADDALLNEKPISREFHLTSSFGKALWLDCFFTSFRRNGQKHLLLMIQNISERKIAENSLVKAKETAEKANKSKSEFLSRMSHELRTPLNAILGFAQVLEHENLDTELHDYASEISDAGKHLLELINELLDLSRIESGKITTVLSAVNLKTVVDQAVRFSGIIPSKNNISFLNLCKPGITVLADSMRLKQILMNLISNALKYNSEGGNITVSCTVPEENRVRIHVSDTGHGIPEEKRTLLFKPFERLGMELTAVEGTGIGLSLSQKLAALMGGELGLERSSENGSVFYLELSGSQENIQEPSKTKKLNIEEMKNKKKILYVEDNPANIKVIQAMFKHYPDILLITAMDGETGIELAKQYQPDAILLDIHLPDKDGYAVLEEIKKISSCVNIPVIALTADAMPHDIEKGMKNGFNEYLTKPVQIQELIFSIKKVIGEIN